MSADRDAWAKECIGQTEADVRASVAAGGGECRVAFRDGRACILTRDYHPDRVNISVRDGIVTKVDFG